jgi:hypothetical protein
MIRFSDYRESRVVQERHHQDIENRLIYAPAVDARAEGAVYRHARLGGTLNFYYRKAA